MTSDLSVGEAARLLGVGVETIRRWLDTGTLDGYVLPSGHRRITAASIDRIRAGADTE